MIRKIIIGLLIIFSLGSAYVGGVSLMYLKGHHQFPFKSNNPNYDIPGIQAYEGSFDSYYWMLVIASLILLISIFLLWKLSAKEN